MDDVEILPTDVITDSLPPLPDIPDFPDIPENVIIVPADPLPITSECLTFPMRHSTTTVTGVRTQLTYVTQGNVSYRCQPVTESASNANTTTINVPTATEASLKSPTLAMKRKQADSGLSPQKIQKTDETVFLPPLPVVGHAKPQSLITKNIPKPKPSSNSDQNKIIKALLAQKSTPYLPRASAPRGRSFTVTASTQSLSGKTNTLNLPVSTSLPVPLGNFVPGTPDRPFHSQHGLLSQRPTLRSAFVKTTTAVDFIPRSSSIDTVMTTHVTTTTAITTPMTAAPQLSYAISPIRVATTAGTTVTTTVASSTGESIVLISSPSAKTRLARARASETYVPMQHLYKASPDATVAANKIHNLVRSKALPLSSGATVTTPPSITMLGPRGSMTTTAAVATPLQRPSANTREQVHNYTYLEPGEITEIHKFPPRTFSDPRSAYIAQRRASEAAAMEQHATMITQMKAAKHAQELMESRARRELIAAREVQHAAALIALQEATHARLVAASQEIQLQRQAKMQAAVEAQKAAATSPSATQAQALPALLQLPVTTQLQIAALGPTQTASLAQPHGTLNVQLVTPAQAQLFADAKAQLHATSQGQMHGIRQTQVVAYSQAQDQPLAASRPQDESTNSQQQGQPWATSQLQGQPLTTSQKPDQPLVTSKPQGHHLPTSQAPDYTSATSQAQILGISQVPILITTQRQDQRLAQSPISVASQRQALIALTQSHAQLLATSQAQSHPTLPTQPKTLPVQSIKSTQPNATLIAQLNAPPQKITSKGQQNITRLQLHATPAQLQNITQAQLNATQAQSTTLQRRPQAASPPQIQISSSPQQSVAHGQPTHRVRRHLIIKTTNPLLDKNPVTQSANNETVAASTSLTEQLPTTSSYSQKIGEKPSSSIHTTSTLTLSTGETLVMPHYKTTVFKNLSSIGRAEPTQLPNPTTTPGEIVVMRRPNTFFPARRTFPTTTQSSTATSVTTTVTTATATTTVTTIIRTVPRHMLGSLETRNVRARSDVPKPEVPMYIITQQEDPESEESN